MLMLFNVNKKSLWSCNGFVMVWFCKYRVDINKQRRECLKQLQTSWQTINRGVPNYSHSWKSAQKNNILADTDIVDTDLVNSDFVEIEATVVDSADEIDLKYETDLKYDSDSNASDSTDNEFSTDSDVEHSEDIDEKTINKDKTRSSSKLNQDFDLLQHTITEPVLLFNESGSLFNESEIKEETVNNTEPQVDPLRYSKLLKLVKKRQINLFLNIDSVPILLNHFIQLPDLVTPYVQLNKKHETKDAKKDDDNPLEKKDIFNQFRLNLDYLTHQCSKDWYRNDLLNELEKIYLLDKHQLDSHWKQKQALLQEVFAHYFDVLLKIQQIGRCVNEYNHKQETNQSDEKNQSNQTNQISQNGVSTLEETKQGLTKTSLNNSLEISLQHLRQFTTMFYNHDKCVNLKNIVQIQVQEPSSVEDAISKRQEINGINSTQSRSWCNSLLFDDQIAVVDLIQSLWQMHKTTLREIRNLLDAVFEWIRHNWSVYYSNCTKEFQLTWSQFKIVQKFFLKQYKLKQKLIKHWFKTEKKNINREYKKLEKQLVLFSWKELVQDQVTYKSVEIVCEMKGVSIREFTTINITTGNIQFLKQTLINSFLSDYTIDLNQVALFIMGGPRLKEKLLVTSYDFSKIKTLKIVLFHFVPSLKLEEPLIIL